MKTSKKLCMIALVAIVGVAIGVPFAVAASHFDVTTLALLPALGLLGEVQLFRSKQLREQRAQLVETNGTLLTRIAAETDAARVKELETEWDKRDADIVTLTASIERAERQEKLDAEMLQPANQRRSGRQNTQEDSRELSADEQNNRREQYRRYFWNAMRFGVEALTPEARAIVRSGYSPINGPVIDLGREQRDGLSTTAANGGYTVPALFFNELQQSLLAFGGAREMARVITTDSGQSLPIPTVDNTANKAQIIGEGSALTSPQDPSFGQVAVPTFMYRSLLPMTLEFMQDTAFDMEAWVMSALTEMVARGTNAHFTTGNGTTQPKGFIPGTNSGVTFAAATSISFNDLVNLEHSVDPAYRRGPSVGWQFNDGTLKTIKKLVDSQSRPLWLPGIAVKEPDTILGYKYVINQDMAAIQASNKSMAFGDWSKFLIRDVRNPLIVRANELYIGNGQIGFFIFSRHGSNVLDAGTDPIKHGTHPSPD